jgi:hypothetical protein
LCGYQFLHYCAPRKRQGPTARYRARNSPKSEVGAQYRANGGEGVSQPPLKDKAFLTFFGQNPPFELPEKGVSPSTKACPAQWSVIDNSAIKRLARISHAVSSNAAAV